jgi:chromate reductase
MNNKIAVLVGSLRKDSLNRKVAHVLSTFPDQSMTYDFINIGQLPLYNQDLEDSEHVPDAWVEFRKQVKDCNGLLFITPEYNRSIPAPLKNAIDVGSRPYGQSVWNDKPGAIVSVSPGGIGGFGANQHLRQVLSCLNIPLLPQPEAYIGHANMLFNEQGELVKEDSLKFFNTFMTAYTHWVKTYTDK